MCDLLTISSRRACKASRSLPAFAICGKHNCDGWGVGFFDSEGRAEVRKSRDPAYRENRDAVDEGLLKVAEEVTSRYFLGHVRFASCGEVCDANCHPFKLAFLGRDWLFAHNGTCRGIVGYMSAREPVLEARNDSARIFEYLRDRLLDAHAEETGRPFFQALAEATLGLVNEFDDAADTFNYLLCNGSALFVFMHHRPFYVLHRRKTDGDALVMTTCGDEGDGGITDGEQWFRMKDCDRDHGLLLMIVDDMIVARQEITRGE